MNAGFSNKHVVLNGKAAFYACVLEDIKQAAYNCGWAIGLHGSLQSDMDLMAMAWTKEATTVDELIKSISSCFSDKVLIEVHHKKPKNRVVYSLVIYGDWYLDLNVVDVNQVILSCIALLAQSGENTKAIVAEKLRGIL